MQYSFTSLLPEAKSPSGLHRMRRLSGYPEIEADVRCAEAQRIGLAGELYLKSEITALGFDVTDLPVQSTADLGLVLGDRLVKLQVKTVLRPRSGAYHAYFRRGYRGSATGTYEYSFGDYDIGAVVLLSDHVVAYLPAGQRSCRIPVDRIPELRSTQTERLYEALCDIGALQPREIETILGG